MLKDIRVHRRQFLVGAAGAAGATAVAGATGFALPAMAQEGGLLPDYAGWKDAAALIIHSERTLETVRDGIGTSGITPSDALYVRNNLAPPGDEVLADRDAWEVAFGGVANPRGMTIGEMKTLGLASVATVLQCSGNGRAFFAHETSGTQWSTGAAGCIAWAGVPLRAVAEALGGVASGARFITGTGGETLPDDIDPLTVIVERSVPLDALDDAILAWEMNGEPLSIAHGGPLRLIVPGYYGVNNVKYVKHLAFTEVETEARIMTSSYRVRPVGEGGAPDQPSMWQMHVKSWVTHPIRDTASGRIQIYGVAFGGTNPVERVEVSTDGGSNWQEATLTGPDLGRFGWRVFVLSADLAPGTYIIASRATDSEGNVQEETTEPNHRGYDYSGWDRLAAEVTVV